ncbi:hypothetical protein D3C86_1376180 [compost metagenome]
MSLALRWGVDPGDDGGFIYLDAVTLYTQSYRGKVTNHPVDFGGNITDHFIRDNPTFRISAVITGADIGPESFAIRDPDNNVPFNSEPQPTALSVNSTDQSILNKFIPDSIGQFLPASTPDVIVDGPRDDVMELVRQFLTELMSGKVYNPSTGQYDPKVQLVRLYEYDGIILRNVVNNLVMTEITFKEDANNGYALFCDISFQQVTFAFLKKTVIPKDVQNALKKKASGKASKGKQDSTPQTEGSGSNPPKTTQADVDPARGAGSNG